MDQPKSTIFSRKSPNKDCGLVLHRPIEFATSIVQVNYSRWFKRSDDFFVLDVLSAELAIDSCVPPTSEYRSI